MSKFLNLIEQFDPQNTEDPKWKLIDYLKSKGIHVELVRDTDMLYIHTDGDVVAVNVSIPEEDSQENDMISDIAKDGTNPQQGQASQVIKKRNQLAPEVIKKAGDSLKEVEKSLKQRPVV